MEGASAKAFVVLVVVSCCMSVATIASADITRDNIPGTIENTVQSRIPANESADELLGTKFCMNPQNRPVDTSKVKSSSLEPFAGLDQKQTDLISVFLANPNNAQPGNQPGATPAELFQAWTAAHNDRVSTFLAVTHALKVVDLYTDATHFVSGENLLEKFSEVRGDRLIVIMNQELMKQWMAAKGKYTLHLENGKVETGLVTFYDHSTQGALHCGYDVQGYTSTKHLPYLHWNYHFSDGMTDIHLDGIRPWILGFIPNPFHLSYNNSDVRHWFGNYFKKFGDPGFKVGKVDDEFALQQGN